jgi:LysM repeat protein
MSPETTPTPTKLCPTCGTRVSEDATRCLVCGADLSAAGIPKKATKAIQGSRMPEISLSLPAAIGLLALFLAIGAIMVFFALRSKPEVVIPMTPTTTATLTVTPTITSTPLPPTSTSTPQPTPTPLSYKVVQNDTCIRIAGTFGVSVNSIILYNHLSTECVLTVGMTLLIPQPTPTVTPLPTNTLSAKEATDAACEKAYYTVRKDDTLSSIAAAYGVSMSAIKEENGLPTDMVYEGMSLTIPLCKKPTPLGPTPTPTLPPPYPAPNLLLPADGFEFKQAEEVVTLQWASVGTLRANEAYAVTIEDITEGQGRKLVAYVTDTKFNVPVSFRNTDKSPHIYRWFILTVRQTGTTVEGNPIWEAAGNASVLRDFIWSGGGGPAATPTP